LSKETNFHLEWKKHFFGDAIGCANIQLLTNVQIEKRMTKANQSIKKKTTTASVSLGVYAFLSKVTRRARMSTGWLFGEEEE